MPSLLASIENIYRPGYDARAASLHSACKKLGLTEMEELADPSKANPERLMRAGATGEALDLAMALLLTGGKPYAHLGRPN